MVLKGYDLLLLKMDIFVHVCFTLFFLLKMYCGHPPRFTVCFPLELLRLFS